MASSDTNKSALQKSSQSDIQAFLNKVDQLPATQGTQAGRLLFAIDATASREASWDMACGIQGEMFSATQKIGGINAQLCYYRGFNEFHSTPWFKQSKDLLTQMNLVTCLGGQTQILQVLKHALDQTQKNKINAVIFIGDACEESADTLANLAGQLGIRGIPLFIFHEGIDPQAKNIFQQLAKLSSGAYLPFNMNSANALSALLGAIAVYATGGVKALEKRNDKAAVQLLTQLKKDQ